MINFLISFFLAVLPPQRMSTGPSVVIIPPIYHNALLSWAPSEHPPQYLYTEVWHSTNHLNWQIYGECSYTNSLTVPMTNWVTITNEFLDSNDVFVCWITNNVNADFFMTVNCEMWSRRITNCTRIKPLL